MVLFLGIVNLLIMLILTTIRLTSILWTKTILSIAGWTLFIGNYSTEFAKSLARRQNLYWFSTNAAKTVPVTTMDYISTGSWNFESILWETQDGGGTCSNSASPAQSSCFLQLKLLTVQVHLLVISWTVPRNWFMRKATKFKNPSRRLKRRFWHHWWQTQTPNWSETAISTKSTFWSLQNDNLS